MALAVLFDFDGTLSTLRSGWETVLSPMMCQCLAPEDPANPALVKKVDQYIDESTGIQTIFQMQWLRDQVAQARGEQAALDPWEYKAEYNRRLLDRVNRRLSDLHTGKAKPEDYLIAGSVALLSALYDRGIKLFVASGTDDADVKNEAEALQIAHYFESITGAPSQKASCSKEMVINRLLTKGGYLGKALTVIGDGKVEIALGHSVGAKTIGVASDEILRRGLSPHKIERLKNAQADWIVGDFLNTEQIIGFILQ